MIYKETEILSACHVSNRELNLFTGYTGGEFVSKGEKSRVSSYSTSLLHTTSATPSALNDMACSSPINGQSLIRT